MRLRLGLLVTLVLALAPASLAKAQADFTGTLSGDNPKFTWESSGSGAPTFLTAQRCVGGPFHCEYVLLDIKSAGELALTVESTQGAAGPPAPGGDAPFASWQDLDAYLYQSDATGTPQGDSLTDGDPDGEADCVTSYPSETCKLPIQPGFYVLEVEYWAALEAPMIGTAELIGAAPSAAAPPPPPPPPPPPSNENPPPPPPSQQQQPQPAQQQSRPAKKKKKSVAAKRRACTKKAKKIKNKRKRARALKRCKRIRR